MTGYILLEGGAEFGGQMAEPDQRALTLAGGSTARISIIPTAAAPDNNHQRAGGNGQRWFGSLGATQVAVVPLIDAASAANPAIGEALRNSRLIYLLGGFPHYLGETLKDSLAWAAALEAYQQGAVLAGSSAGAMVLCDYYFNPSGGDIVDGLGLVSNACVLPHHNAFGRDWAPRLTELLPEAVLIGIDERTGMLNDGPDGAWTVYGQGTVTLYRGEVVEIHQAGQRLSL